MHDGRCMGSASSVWQEIGREAKTEVDAFELIKAMHPRMAAVS
jgi:hypothetical protein